MSRAHTELLARIGLAGAIVPTYRNKIQYPNDRIGKLLNAIDFYTTASIRFYGRVGAENIEKIGQRIDYMNAESCMGKARSILTFIDFSVELLEQTLSPDGDKKPIADINGRRGRVYIQRLIKSLVNLRLEVCGNKNFEICSIAGIKAAEIWRQA